METGGGQEGSEKALRSRLAAAHTLVMNVKVRFLKAVSLTGIGVSGIICEVPHRNSFVLLIQSSWRWRVRAFSVAALNALQNSTMFRP